MLRTNRKMRFISILLTLLLIVMLGVPAQAATEPTVDLGTTSTFAVLAGSTITNTGSTVINGDAGADIGVSPSTSITGFPPGIVTGGTIYTAGSTALQAQNDLVTAYNDVLGRTTTMDLTGQDLGGLTLTTGVYSFSSSAQLTGTLTLDAQGDPDAVFIFKIGSALTTATGSNISLVNGARYCRTFFQVGSSATLGVNSHFAGHIFAFISITANTGATVQGQLLARNGAVTLDGNTITNGICSGSITVNKNVSGNILNVVLPVFEITVSGPGGFNNTQVIGAGSSYTWTNLMAGTYRITENALGTNWVVNGVGDYIVADGINTPADITNTYTALGVGSLTVNKIVTGETTGIALPVFEITVTGPNGFKDMQVILAGGLYTWSNLPTGAYTVAENSISEDWTISGDGEYIVDSGTDTPVVITNMYAATAATGTPIVTVAPVVTVGALTVAKIVSGDINGITLPEFTMTVTGPGGFIKTKTFQSGETYTWNNLVPGTYRVTEVKSELGKGWVVTGEGVVTITADTTSSRTITNTHYTTLPATGGFGPIIPYIGLAVTGLGFMIRKKHMR